MGVKATWTGFAFHWTPTPRNYNFNGDDDDVENDDDYSDGSWLPKSNFQKSDRS